MGIIYGIRVHSWHQGLLCGVWGATLHLIYNTREQLGNWTRFVISGCSLVVFGAQFCSILSTKMQLSSSRVQLCSIWEAAPHPMYNIGVYLCTIYTIGVQLSSICVSFRSVFCHIYDARGRLCPVRAAFLVFGMLLLPCAVRGCSFPTFPRRKPGFVRAGAGAWCGVCELFAGISDLWARVLGRQSPWQRLVKRMTRFFTRLDADGSYRALKEVCEKMGYGWKMSCTNQVRLRGLKSGLGHPPRAAFSGNNSSHPSLCRSPSRPRTGGTTNSSSR